jgi:hypothetical protein
MSPEVITEIKDMPIAGSLAFTARLVRRPHPALALGARVVGRRPDESTTPDLLWVYGSLWKYGFGIGFSWTWKEAP